jgi:hypothetical protein
VDTRILCEINTKIPGPQEEIERVFRTSVKVFNTLTKTVKQSYTITIDDEHLPEDNVLTLSSKRKIDITWKIILLPTKTQMMIYGVWSG